LSVDPKSADKTELAEERTDWAEDRTILASERTFAGWVRTGLASLAVASPGSTRPRQGCGARWSNTPRTAHHLAAEDTGARFDAAWHDDGIDLGALHRAW
jgi:hypothetical protein